MTNKLAARPFDSHRQQHCNHARRGTDNLAAVIGPIIYPAHCLPLMFHDLCHLEDFIFTTYAALQ